MGLMLSGEPRRLSEEVRLVLRSTIRLLDDWLLLMMLGRMVTSSVRAVSSWRHGLLLTLKSTGSTCTEEVAGGDEEAIASLLAVVEAVGTDLGTVLKGTDPFLLLAPEALKMGVIVTECCMIMMPKQDFQVILTQ